MAIVIEFQKYTQAGTDDYTTLEPQNPGELASALINVLTNRKKGFPREVVYFDVSEDGQDVSIRIATHVTQVKPRASKRSITDPTML